MYNFWTTWTKNLGRKAYICALITLLAASIPAADSTPPTNATFAPPASTNASTLPTTLSGYVPDDKYKLRAGDRVAFQILEDRDAPKSLFVADSGELDFPYVGRVAAVD